MKVNGINPNKVVSLYSEHKKAIEKKDQVQKNDTVQISSLGKSLSSYSLDDKFINSNEKIERLTNEVKNGTYNIDSKLIAAKIIEEMKM